MGELSMSSAASPEYGEYDPEELDFDFEWLQQEQSEECLSLLQNYSHPEIAIGNAYFGLGISVFSWIYYSVFLVLYFLRRRNSVFLKYRSFSLIALMTLAFMYEATWSFREFVGRHLIPCYWTQPSVMIPIFIALVPMAIRVVSFWRRVEYSKYAANVQFYKSFKASYLAQFGTVKGNADEILPTTGSAMIGDNHLGLGDETASKPKSDGVDEQSSDAVNNEEEERKRQQTLRIKKFLASKTFSFTIFCSSLVVFFGLSYDLIAQVPGCYGCEYLESRYADVISSALFFLASFVIIIFVLYKVRKEPDPLNIIQEIKLAMKVALFFIIVWAILDAPDVGALYADGKIYWGYFLQLGFLGAFTVMVPLQIYKSYRVPKFNLAEQNQKEFKDVRSEFELYMESKIVQNNFKLHLMNEFSVENFYFWQEIEKWQKSFGQSSAAQKFAQFLFIVDNYVLANSVFEVNVDGPTKDQFQELKDKVQKDGLVGEEITQDVFDEALSQVLRLLVYGPFLRFKLREQRRSEEEAAAAPFEAARMDTEQGTV